MAAEYVTIDNYIVAAETRLAIGVVKMRRNADGILVKLASNATPEWIPRSVCDDSESLEIGDTDISVAKWFAEKEGLDY